VADAHVQDPALEDVLQGQGCAQGVRVGVDDDEPAVVLVQEGRELGDLFVELAEKGQVTPFLGSEAGRRW
jgi:uncharacterized lipoprotein YajG